MKVRVVPSIILTVFLVIVAVSSCVSIKAYKAYEGETLPKSQIAILRETTHFYVISFCSTNLKTIDGRDVNEAGMVELLPGPHKVSFLLEFDSYGSNSRSGSFEFQAEAGHVYKLDVAECTSTPPLQAWIEDEVTGKVVAGTKPKEAITEEPDQSGAITLHHKN